MRYATASPPAPDHPGSARLAPPVPRRAIVVRPRLLDLLDRGAGALLTTVVAPAGSGKTTLLSAWARSRPGMAWISLSADDAQPASFWQSVIQAIQQVVAPAGASALELLRAAQAQPIEAALDLLAADLAESGRPAFTLVVDELPPDAPIAALLDLAERCGGRMRLVIAARGEPHIPLARLRAQGELAEVGPEALRFTSTEAASLLRASAQLRLSDAQVAAIDLHTAGWAAGLQLAALALRGHGDPERWIAEFDGSHRYIAEYLLAEVLAHAAPAVREFLHAAAPLERLCGPLCDAVMQQDGTGALLSQLHRDGMLIERLDERGAWFRLHPLLREHLLVYRQRDDPARTAECQRRAARWYERAGDSATAAAYWLAAGDTGGAARCIAQATPALLRRSELGTLRGWVERLPDEIILATPGLCIARAWLCLDANRPDLAAPALDALERAARLDTALRSEALALRAVAAAMEHRPDEALGLARAARQLGAGHDTGSAAYTAFALGAAAKMSFDAARAEDWLRDAAALADAAGNTYVARSAHENLADIAFNQARLDEAEQANRRALELAAIAPGVEAPAAGLIRWALARIAYERDDLAGAAEQAELSVALCARWRNNAMLARALLLRSRIRRLRGDHSGADDDLEAGGAAARRADDPLSRGEALRERIAQQLGEGRLAAAQRLAAGLDPAGEPYPFAALLMLARVRLAERRPTEAATLIAPALDGLIASGLVRLQIQALALQALATQHTRADALRALAWALVLAQPGGLIRSIADEGRELAGLLAELSDPQIDPAYLARLRAALPPAPGAPGHSVLTPREREALQLLAAGLSNRAIADRLTISEGTLKRHLSNIYLKLQVHSRTQALARAAELGLLWR